MTLIAHYLCNDNDATITVVDATGNGHTGWARHNTNLLATTGKIGGGLSVSGTDYISVPRFAPTGSCTYSLWVNPSTIPSQAGYLSQSGTLMGDFTLRDSGDNRRHLVFMRRNAGPSYTWTTQHSIALGQWCFVAVVYGGANVLQAYINDASETLTGTSTTITGSSYPFFIGRQSSYPLFAVIDDVRVYDEALTPTQIAAIYNNGNGTEAAYPWLAARPLIDGSLASPSPLIGS